MIFAMVFFTAAAIIGLILLLISLVMYYSRTKDKKFWTRFWLGKDLLSKEEHVLNRSGFFLAILGTILMYTIGIVKLMSSR